MLKNFLLISLRNLKRGKVYSIINLSGLAIGFTSFILMALYIVHEVSFDQFHENKDRIYRVNTKLNATGKSDLSVMSTVGWPYGRIMKEEIPEVEEVVYMRYWQSYVVKHEGEYFYDKLLHADAGFFKVFSFPLLKGDPQTALKDPYTIVITEKLEKKYFPGGSGLNKVLVLNDSLQFRVTGIVKDIPSESHMQFDGLVSFATFVARNPHFNGSSGWFDLNMCNYVLLKKGAQAKAIERKIASIPMDKNGKSFSEMGYDMSLDLQPLNDIYLNNSISNSVGETGNRKYVYVLSVIACFIIFIACVNFVNLSTAKSAERSREVGVRKAIGSTRKTLIFQFISESFVYAFLSLILAFMMISMLLPVFNSMAGKEFTMDSLFQPTLAFIIGSVFILTGFVAGIYPALVLSRFNPVLALKGILEGNSSRGGGLRKVLVISQFTLSVILIICTVIAYQQIHYMQQQKLGFDKEKVVVIDSRKAPYKKRLEIQETIKEELKRNSFVTNVSASYSVPGKYG
jgi:putative ABC transport system permease protein